MLFLKVCAWVDDDGARFVRCLFQELPDGLLRAVHRPERLVLRAWIFVISVQGNVVRNLAPCRVRRA